MSGGNTLFNTLHYTDKVIYTGQEANLCLSPYYDVNIVYTCQEANLCLSPYTSLTRLFIHVRS